MDLYVLALTTEPGEPYAWLDENVPRRWMTTGVWTFEEPPVAFPPTIPCLVPASARDRLHLADCEDKPFGQWIISEHKVDRLELRHWRRIAFTQAPLPCGGVFPCIRTRSARSGGRGNAALGLSRKRDAEVSRRIVAGACFSALAGGCRVECRVADQIRDAAAVRHLLAHGLCEIHARPRHGGDAEVICRDPDDTLVRISLGRLREVAQSLDRLRLSVDRGGSR